MSDFQSVSIFTIVTELLLLRHHTFPQDLVCLSPLLSDSLSGFPLALSSVQILVPLTPEKTHVERTLLFLSLSARVFTFQAYLSLELQPD